MLNLCLNVSKDISALLHKEFIHYWNLPLPKLQGNLSQGLHTLAKLSCIRCTGITQEVTSVDPLRKTNNNFKKILILMKD